ncbi:MAG: glycosyltransferase, partial [Nitrososphaeria archaeon]
TPALKCNQKNFLILRNIFKRNNLNVYIECRNLDEREKFLEFTSSDVYLYPSLGTAAIDPPLTVLEAMLSCCLVVATNVQSIPWILSGDRGIIIDSSNLSKEITNSLIIALDKKRRNKIINNAKAYIRSVHSIESVSRKLDAIINESM